MTPEEIAQQERWTKELMSLSREITDVQSDIDDDNKALSEKKKKRDSMLVRLKEMAEQGPFGGENGGPTLWDDVPETPDEDSIRSLKLPTRYYGILEQAGISTISRLREIVDGVDAEYPNLDAIDRMDVDARNRILGEFTDEDEDEDDLSPSSSTLIAPVQESVEGTPANVEENLKIRILVEFDEIGVKKGDCVSAIVKESGQAFFRYGKTEEDTMMLEENEYEMVGA